MGKRENEADLAYGGGVEGDAAAIEHFLGDVELSLEESGVQILPTELAPDPLAEAAASEREAKQEANIKLMNGLVGLYLDATGSGDSEKAAMINTRMNRLRVEMDNM